MSYYKPKPGLMSAGSYQVSGKPYLTGSTIAGPEEVFISFPSVTKSFTIINKSAEELYIHFDSRTNANVISQHHYVSLPNQNDSFVFDVRCKQVYLSLSNQLNTGSYEMFAELTGIEPSNMHPLTGSGINEV